MAMTELQQQARELHIALSMDVETMSAYQVSVLAVMLADMHQQITEELFHRILNRVEHLGDGSKEHSDAVHNLAFDIDYGGRLRDMAVLFPEQRSVANG